MKKETMRIFWIGQEVKVNNKFYAWITGPANHEGSVVSLSRVNNGKIESGYCGTKGLEPAE